MKIPILILMIVFGFMLARAIIPPVVEKTKDELLEEAISVIDKNSFYSFDPVACRGEVRQAMFNPPRDYERKSTNCLDKYFKFTPAQKLREMKFDWQTNIYSAGVVLREVAPGEVRVVRPIEGGPAEKAGVKTGDRILSVRDAGRVGTLKIKTAEKLAEYLKGPLAGVKVFFTIDRQGEILTLGVSREKIPYKEITYKKLGNGILYVTVEGFGLARTHDDWRAALEKASSGNSRVIVDVRGIPGGNPMVARDMLCEFAVKDGDVVAVQKTSSPKDGSVAPPLVCEKTGRFNHYKVVVLVDGYSASASEMFAGVLQDWNGKINRFLILGTKTYGKGVVQQGFTLADNSMLELTTFEFLVGNSHMSVHGIGITPDYPVTDSRAGFADTGTLKDRQFMKAIEILKNIR